LGIQEKSTQEKWKKSGKKFWTSSWVQESSTEVGEESTGERKGRDCANALRKIIIKKESTNKA